MLYHPKNNRSSNMKEYKNAGSRKMSTSSIPIFFKVFLISYKLSPKSSRNFSIKRFGQLLVGSRPPMKKRSTGGS